VNQVLLDPVTLLKSEVLSLIFEIEVRKSPMLIPVKLNHQIELRKVAVIPKEPTCDRVHCKLW
jgi:hypothetical protein